MVAFPPPSAKSPALLALAAALVGCASAPAPVPFRENSMVRQVGARYRAFYPAVGDPDQDEDVGLLRPRFGLPAIAQAGAPFPMELLERGGLHPLAAALLRPGVPDADARRCVEPGAAPVAGCYLLDLQPQGSGAVARQGAVSLARYQARPRQAPPPGGYDLYLRSAVDAPERVPRAVWLRAEDPATLAQLSVVQLSDLHVGKGRHGLFLRRLEDVIGDVNAVAPDLVIVTGDLVNRGQDPALALRAQSLLLGLEAPVLVIMGNHDIEFSLNPFKRATDRGWPNFARAFHPYREFSLSLGGYEFIGFDSGPAERSPRVLTRGLEGGALDQLRAEVEGARREGLRGVVLFSHAPSRASLSVHAAPGRRGFFGRMRHGNAAFEQILLDAAERGQRVLHLAGHTHWSDVFEAEGEGQGLHFAQWPQARLSDCPRPIHGLAALITTQAASHSGAFFKPSARGYGFAVLQLGDGEPAVAFHRYGVQQAACPGT